MHSSLQKVLDRIDHAELLDKLHGMTEVTDSERRVIRNMLSNVAHYVIDERIIELVGSDKVEKSMRALVQAGIRQLPFDPMLIEMPDLRNGRAFVRLQTHAFDRQYELSHTDIYAYVYCTMTTSTHEFMVLSLRPGVPLHIKWDDVGDSGFFVAVGHAEDDEDFPAAEHLGLTAVAAMMTAMFMLNTRGVVTERVKHDKLNKQRAKKGKAPIRDYTVVRIGQIYDSAGTAHDVNGTGRHMPVHWRSAHVRNVRYGPYNEPAKHRPVFIPACLVNYEPADDKPAPLPKKEIVMSGPD